MYNKKGYNIILKDLPPTPKKKKMKKKKKKWKYTQKKRYNKYVNSKKRVTEKIKTKNNL